MSQGFIKRYSGNNILLDVYPVGAVYISVNDADPGTLFGGTWEAFGTGRTLVGVDTGQTEFDTVEETGGAKTHTLTTAEMPTHTHVQNAHTHTQNAHAHASQTTIMWGGSPANPGSNLNGGPSNPPPVHATNTGSGYTGHHFNVQNATATNQNTTATNQNAGSGNAHNNLPPYITVYMFKRVA